MKKQPYSLTMFCALLLSAVMLFTYGLTAVGESLTTDYTALTWTDAFTQLHARMEKEYAFTDWKSVDWAALGEKYGAEIQAVQTAHDFTAYYLALRGFIHAIPDGHVHVTNLKQLDDQFIGGGFGLAVTTLDDGRTVITWVDPTSPAAVAGLKIGDELLTWNGLPVQTALEQVEPIFDSNAATAENVRAKRAVYLTRASVGAQVQLTCQSSTGSTISATLTAYDDSGLSIKKCYPAAVLSDKIREMFKGVDTDEPAPDAMVQPKMLNDNIGYIRIWGELDADLAQTGNMVSTLGLFRDAIDTMIDNDCKALIIDLRNNLGGEDAMSASMLGSFYAQQAFYEYQNVYDETTGTRAIVRPDGSDTTALMILPADRVFTGRVIALVNLKCVSSGEGLALGIRNLPNGDTLGFFGTHGSFGLCGPEANLPGGLTVGWPSGQSLDADKCIQVDSRNMVGGVAPTIRVPMNLENALRVVAGEDVELAMAIQALGGKAE
jgi:carboxyl-terminal processing protease